MEYQLADLFEALCDAKPEALCLVAGSRRYSRQQLDQRANQLAHHLISCGVQPGQHVGVYAYNRGEWIEALLACWKIRAVAININYRYVTEELRYIWQNADMVALIYERGFVDPVNKLRTDFPDLKHYLVLDDESFNDSDDLSYESALSQQSVERGFQPRSSDDIFMIYTGGTTGMPKGVMWRHEDWYHNVVCMNTATSSPEDILQHADNPNALRSLTLSPLMHGGGQFAVLIALLRGGLAAIPVSKSFDPDEVLRVLKDEGIMLLSLIGDAMARPIAEAQLKQEISLPDLAIISSGGAILSAEGRTLLKQAFGEKIYLTGGIGGSEIGSAAVESGSSDDQHTPHFKPNPMMAVLDDNLDVIQPGDTRPGYLGMKGFIPLGYYKDREKTADVFRTDKKGIRWVLAGDRAQVEKDGSFTLLGRDSQCINSGGEKIFVEEVERAVLSHPAVRFCLVTGVSDPRWQQRVVALVELEKEQALTLATLQSHCRQYIAGYKVPRQLITTKISSTPNGKPDYKWARKIAEQHAEEYESLMIN